MLLKRWQSLYSASEICCCQCILDRASKALSLSQTHQTCCLDISGKTHIKHKDKRKKNRKWEKKLIILKSNKNLFIFSLFKFTTLENIQLFFLASLERTKSIEPMYQNAWILWNEYK